MPDLIGLRIYIDLAIVLGDRVGAEPVKVTPGVVLTLFNTFCKNINFYFKY